MINKTTILITKETRNELKDIGKKGESYEEVIKKLLKNFKDHQL